MSKEVVIKEIESKKEKKEICEKILRSLSNWFGIEQAILDYIQDAQKMPMLVAFDGSDLTGFTSLNLHNKSTGEIHVMGVLPDYHRSGAGKAMVRACENYLLAKNCQFITVKTLSSSKKDTFYERTRKFYESMGFYPLEELKTLWGEANPCFFMAKPLQSHFGKLHHIEIYVSDLERSQEFWGWLLKKLGYFLFQEFDGGKSWKLDETYIVFVQTQDRYLDVPYHRCRTGLNHLAFHAKSRQHIDELTDELKRRKVNILYQDKHPFAGGPDSYAVFFEDPDRIKVEVAATKEEKF